jgi:hypothetical protein
MNMGVKTNPIIMLRYLCVLSLLTLVSATITIGERYYQSMPAVFGMPWHPMGLYKAHIQILEDNPFLCQGLGLTNFSRRLPEKNETVVEPTDGIPVVLLASRGACSFEEKARTAMKFGDFVRYVIVYDDHARSSLVPMSAADPDGITVGMLFVSQTAGLRKLLCEVCNNNHVARLPHTYIFHFKELRQTMLQEPPTVKEEGGLIITMDSRSPPMPPSYNQTQQQWMLAAMAGIFSFLGCFGCLLVGLQAGYIPAQGGSVTIGHTTITSPTTRLLTEARVRRLPEEPHNKDAEHHACAICIEEYREGEMLRVLPCSHRFHTDCIVPWLTERQASCPLCKYDIARQDITDDDEESGRGLVRWGWSWRRSDMTLVSTEEEETAETPHGDEPPSSPNGAPTAHQGNAGDSIPGEAL